MKRGKVIAMGLVMIMFLQASTVLAHGNEQTASIGDVNVKFSNTISSDKLHASATTWTSHPSAQASVSATFYYADYAGGNMSSCYISGGNYGSKTIYPSVPTGITPYYYRVVSTHSAYYNNGRASYSNLTTFVP